MGFVRTTKASLAVVLAALVFTTACATRAPHINDLKTDPGRYYERTVSVEGTVTSSWGVPLVPIRVYRIDDGTGELTVVSQRDRVPAKGAKVRVTGKVQELAMFGGQSFGLHVQEHRLSVLRR